MRSTKAGKDIPARGRESRKKEETGDIVERAGEESFPASDPPSWTPLHTGRRDRKEAEKPADKGGKRDG